MKYLGFGFFPGFLSQKLFTWQISAITDLLLEADTPQVLFYLFA